MGNNSIGQNENILVVVDQENIVHIDPNSVINSDGEVQQRLVDHENLVIYVNLEADLIPRSIFVSESQENTLRSVASGTFNMLRNQGDKNIFENNFDTNWTSTFTSTSSQTSDANSKYDPTAQTFGIENINIVVQGVNAIPQVNINFIDVRGKTLFESPENSPYKAFFHQPWPIFYLTVKGYFGKAIRYRLHLIDFKSKFNGTTGNFEINTKFVGSTFAYLSDIILQNVINAPFMYMVEKSEPFKTNQNTGLIEKKISKTTKGYTVLKSIYDEYKAKGYISKNFPVKTLRDLLMTANAMDKIIEQALFDENIDPSVLSAVYEYEKLLTNFEKKVIAWGNVYLDKRSEKIVATIDEFDYFGFKKEIIDKSKTNNNVNYSYLIFNSSNGEINEKSLETIINTFIESANKNTAFGNNIDNTKKIKTNTISLSKISNIKDFYTPNDGKYGVAIEKLIKKIKEIETTFIQNRSTIQDFIENEMNKVISNKKTGFGFAPTMRNVFAVILANAETYIRLMQDVHYQAISNKNRKTEIKIDGDKNEGLYPWPEIKIKKEGSGAQLLYPGDPSIVKTTKGNDYSLWPEILFIDNYLSVGTKRIDTLSGNEINSSVINFLFEDNDDTNQRKNVSELFSINKDIAYINKTLSNFIYEIYERAFYITSYDTFDPVTLADIEFKMIDNIIINDIDLKQILRTQISTPTQLIEMLKLLSPIQRYPYFQDRLPTVDYIKELVTNDFKISDYKLFNSVGTSSTDESYPKIEENIKLFSKEEYRKNIYPFSSDVYSSYVDKSYLNNISFNKALNVNKNDQFISTQVNPRSWVNDISIDGDNINIFDQALNFDGIVRNYNNPETFIREDFKVISFKNILNTPYFHKQLFSDFMKGGISERYVGSAYLLLNSLSFKDLDDLITFNGVTNLMSNLFREVGSTHYIPYHLILKWGSQYHRYKKYLNENIDIIDNITTPINGQLFFDNDTDTFLDLSQINSSLSYVKYSDQKYVGLYPYYHGIYHQIINGYSFYNLSGFTSTDASLGYLTDAPQKYQDSITNNVNKIIYSKTLVGSGYTFTSIIDNSKFSESDKRYTILPSGGGKLIIQDLDNFFIENEQNSFTLNISSKFVDPNFFPNYTGATIPTYNKKFKTFDNEFSLVSEQKKIFDLIATFGSKMLDEMESKFLKFASLDLNTDNPDVTIHSYDSFQKLLKAVSSIDQTNIDFTSPSVSQQIKTNQLNKLRNVSNEILSTKNILTITIGNPKQIDNYYMYGLLGKLENFFINQYENDQLTTENLKLIELHIGENIEKPLYSDLGNLYLNFFQINNIELNANNIYAYREISRIYAGWVNKERVANNMFTPTKELFLTYLTTNIYTPQEVRLETYLKELTKNFASISYDENNSSNNITQYNGFNEDKTIKLDLYQFFKSFNDKWIAGNAIGQRNLMDEFLFIDRANRDIGDEAYISFDRLLSLSNEKNSGSSLYSVISMLIQQTGFDMRPLPAYINFYGSNTFNQKKINPSKNLAKDLFGTYLDVDYQDSNPKIIIQYVNQTSKYLDMSTISKEYKFKNDGVDVRDPINNPLLVQAKIFEQTDLSKSNRVVSFNINFGDQSQGMFKSISIDQSTYKNTTESAYAIDQLAKSDSSGGSHQVDNGLYDIYRTVSYSCNVTAMGNIMIQPTMYFYLANVPMFNGTYLITDVSHSISNGNFETTFSGVRISVNSFPKLENSYIAGYRPLYDKAISTAIKKKNEIENSVNTEITVVFGDNKKYTIDPGNNSSANNVSQILINESGFHQGLIPYNGIKFNQFEEKYILYVEPNKNNKWLYAKVVLMGGRTYTIDDNTEMKLLSGLQSSPNVIKTWKDIKESTSEYYSVRMNLSNKTPENVFQYNTEFLNPNSNNNEPYNLITNINPTTETYNGPVHNGPKINGDKNSVNFGIAMNSLLMKKLNLNEGDIVYFRLKKK